MIKNITSFSAGEFDPALQERTTLQKYETGLATARNIVVRKTGGAMTTAGTKLLAQCKEDGKKVILHDLSKMYDGYFLEFGHEYVRLRRSMTYRDQVFPFLAMGQEEALTFTEDDLDKLQIVNGLNGIVYVFCEGKDPIGLRLINPGGDYVFQLIPSTDLFKLPPAPLLLTTSTVGGTGYYVDYAVTQVFENEESPPMAVLPPVAFQIPTAINTKNDMTIRLIATGGRVPRIMRIYRRPTGGQAYGFIGYTTNISTGGGYYNCSFSDLGQAADYTTQPPAPNPGLIDAKISDAKDFKSAAGLVYQQRLLQAHDSTIEASRVAYPNNYWRDFPYSSDSALTLKMASSGWLRIRRLLDADGLIVFTTHGVFTQNGVMGPNNLALTRRGPWVIEPSVPPLVVPGAVLFVDESANVIRQLAWSQEGATYMGPDISVFSDHLFFQKRVVSMAFTNDVTPLLWVVFHDGTFCTLTYDREQEMRAWTRHDYADAECKVEYVIATQFYESFGYGPQVSKPIFAIAKSDGTRWLEMGVARFARIETMEDDPEFYMGETSARMHSMKSYRNLLNDQLDPGDYFELVPVTPGDWEDTLTLTCGTSELFEDPGIGEVGTQFRWFHPITKESILLEVVSRTSDDEVVVEPSAEFPSEYAQGFRLYGTYTTLTGLGHLEGEKVSVMGDGYVIASPNNDDESYPELTVVGGEITLPPEIPAPAIVHVGRPFTADLETLAIATVEQKPTLIEPVTINKLYIKVQRTRGLYIGSKFPANNKVAGMERPQVIDGEPMTDGNIVGNRYQEPVSKRYELTLGGDWETNGRVCVRVVDPVHAEILSIIPDVEANLRRGD